MNIIINGFHDKETFSALNKALSNFDVKYFASIYFEDKNKIVGSDKYDFLSWEKINWDGDYEVDWDKIRPLDEKIVFNLAECETIFLKMMDRFERQGKIDYGKRKLLYLKHLRFWNHLIEEKNIDLFVSSNIPHEGADFVTYSLCQAKGIPTIIFIQSHVTDTLLMMEDYKISVAEIKDTYDNLIQSGSKIDLEKRFLEYYQNHTNLDANIAPFYMSRVSLTTKTHDFMESVYDQLSSNSHRSLRKWFSGHFIAKLLKVNLVKIQSYFLEKSFSNFYRRQAKQPELNRKFIYVPLHYQPELTTSPCAGAFVEQLLMVQLLSASVPKDVYLYVKEHPKQDSLGRSLAFYQELAKMRNVKLTPRDYDSSTLSQHSLAVATAIGTAGWEALFQKKPVIMFGNDFYQYAPGVFAVKSATECKNAMEKIIAGAKPDHLDVFLYALQQNSIYGYLDIVYRRVTTLTVEENIENISMAITEKIKQISSRIESIK